MSKNIKRIFAALLIIIGGMVLLGLSKDRFVRMFIIACIVFFATYLNKRQIKRQQLAELRAKLEKEIIEEEESELGNTETSVIDIEPSDAPQEEIEEDKAEKEKN